MKLQHIKRAHLRIIDISQEPGDECEYRSNKESEVPMLRPKCYIPWKLMSRARAVGTVNIVHLAH